MSDPKLQVALDDVFNGADTPEFTQFALSAELQEEIEAFCENEDIPMGQVDMLETLKTAQVVITIVPFEGL